MRRLTWVQPSDLLAHELVASAEDGKDPALLADVAERWREAGGSTEAPVGGAGDPVGPELAMLADELLDELDRAAASPLVTECSDINPGVLTPGLMSEHSVTRNPAELPDRLLGAWTGRAAGCLLGKPVEKLPREGIREILQSQGRWPLSDWFTAVGLPADVAARWPWNRRSAATSLAERLPERLAVGLGMPEDDDLNFAMLALRLLEDHGDALTTDDVAQAWLDDLPAGRVFTAERVAYRNLLLGFEPPVTAVRHNPFREWIGAWIRADVYGWTHPGDGAAAARLALEDARLSHVRNGVYGAMFVAAACAEAVVGDDVEGVIAAGLSVVPPESRLAEAIRFGVELGRSEPDTETALDALHAAYGNLHWVHVLNNAALTAYALVAGHGVFERAVPIGVMGGWDTDSVGATVGSICGALSGFDALPDRWVAPLHDRVASTLPGFDGIALSALAERTGALVEA